MERVTLPKNGLLSGMILPAAAALAVIPLGLFHEPFRQRFNLPLTPELLQLLLISIVVMAIHKAESFLFGEYDQCPVYRTSGEASWAGNPRKAIFVSFVGTFIGMLFLLYFALLGQPWLLMIFAVWLAQGLHEIHHSAKSLARKRIYPGVFTSILFVGILSFGIFPRWHDLIFQSRGYFFYVYYLAIPTVFMAFFLEDRKWIAKTPKSIWNPA